MKCITILTLLIIASNSYSLEFKVSLWSKLQNCPQAICLPQTQTTIENLIIEEPALNSFTQVKVPHENFLIKFTFTKRGEFGGYYSFQTEIVDNTNKKIIALCSRYEGLHTFENAPVGACAGVHPDPDKDELIGVSIFQK